MRDYFVPLQEKFDNRSVHRMEDKNLDFRMTRQLCHFDKRKRIGWRAEKTCKYLEFGASRVRLTKPICKFDKRLRDRPLNGESQEFPVTNALC